jgi:hypothetical protein
VEPIRFKIPEYIPEALSLAGIEYPEKKEYLESFIERWGGLDQKTILRALQEGAADDRFFAVCAVAAYANEMMSVSPEYQIEEVDEFVDRWGKLIQETFLRVLREGEGEDTLFAIFALGYLGATPAREHLLPFLESAQATERWASALSLGTLREERALPVLTTLLTENVLAQQQMLDWEQRITWQQTGWRYDAWLYDVIRILGAWGDPDLAPSLRHALEEIRRLVEREPPHDARKGIVWFYNAENLLWKGLEDDLVFALGQLGAYGALSGLQCSPAQLQLWMVHLVMGFLHQRYPLAQIVKWREHPELRAEVATRLGQKYGLVEEERERCLAQYEHTFLSRNYSTLEKMYQRRREERKASSS